MFGRQFAAKGLAEIAGIIIAFAVILPHWRKSGKPLHEAVQFVSWICIAAIIGGHAAYGVLFDREILSGWKSFMDFSRGYSSLGSILAGFAAARIFCAVKKYNFPRTIDGIVAGLLLFHIFAKTGCFLAGCCWGAPTKFPFAIIFTHTRTGAPLNISLHPVQLYEVAAVIAILVFIVRKKTRFVGEKVLWYGCFYGFARFMIEFFRADPSPVLLSLRIDQIWAAALFIACGVVIVFKYNSNAASGKTPVLQGALPRTE